MVFGLEKLQNEVFCLTEERDYFQAKFLEQVSEIVSLKEELRKSRKEVNRLRKELMKKLPAEDESSELDILSAASPRSRTSICAGIQSGKMLTPPASLKNGEPKSSKEVLPEHEQSEEVKDAKLKIDEDDDQKSDLSASDDEKESDDDNNRAEDIRQSAEKLLQWASYRTSTRSTPDHSSVASPTSSLPSLLGSSIPRTINTEDMDSLLEPKNDNKEQEDTASIHTETESDDTASCCSNDEDDTPKKRSLVDKFERLVTNL